jgi:TetR/AcrR family transcriptional regulator, repressor for neighboring sulfatase
VAEAAVKRRRRSSQEARAEILAIAERQLAEAGPEAIRLQAIADEMGVTHPAILRHFGTREDLLRALLRHAARRLREALARSLPEPGGALDLDSFAESLERIFRGEGYARLLAWLLLSGLPTQGSGMFRAAADEIHAARPRAKGGRGPGVEDTLFSIVLLNMVLWADALGGGAFRRALDLPADRETARRFRKWLVALVQERLGTE